jgi:hypothetical protein
MCIQGDLLFIRGVVPSFLFAVLVAVSQKIQFRHSKNGKMCFLWDETKIGLCGVPRHHMGHAHVRYGLISKNYSMIRAKSSSLFDLKAMQPRTWQVIFVKEISGKLLLSRFDFFYPRIGDIK